MVSPRWRRREWLAAAAVLAAAPGWVHCVDQAEASFQLWGYYPWWMRGQWKALKLGPYRRVGFFSLEIEEDGGLTERHGWPQDWAGLREALRSQGRQLDLTVFLGERARFEQVFRSDLASNRLLEELLSLVGSQEGLQLDLEVYEALSAPALRGFTRWCERLRSEWRSHGGLSAFGPVGAVTDLYGPALVPLMDHVVVQGYDYHEARSPRAGPLSPLSGTDTMTWRKALTQYLGLGWPRHKLLFSLPFYGYEWPVVGPQARAAATGEGEITSYAPIDAALLPDIRGSARLRAERHGLQRDPVSGSPYYRYRNELGQWRQGWFEDEVSLEAKLRWLREEGLAGAAVFPMGYDAGAFDALLARHFRAG